MRGFNYKKATQALNFFSIKEGGKINKMKSIKLIFLADRLHLLLHGRTVTGDTYFALPKGPVPSSTRDVLEQNDIALGDDELGYSSNYLNTDIESKYEFASKAEVDYDVFSETDINTLNLVYQEYGKYDQFQLVEISHMFPEWKKFEAPLESKVASRFPMNEADFFSTPLIEAEIFNIPSELIDISKEIYLENISVANFLNA